MRPHLTRGYSSSEDEIKKPSLSATISAAFSAQETTHVVTPKTIRAHSPECGGCQDHDKAMMISYQLDEDENENKNGL